MSSVPADSLVRLLADQAFSRAAGAPLVPGNHVRILRNAAENYPAWEAAIAGARHHVHIEMYMFYRDTIGRRFRDLLIERARAGVRVRLLVDWLGAWKQLLVGAYRPIVAAGGELRVMNPPGFTSMLGWMQRDHRKLVAVDGEVAFVSGLCIGDAWTGNPDRGLLPWRDTGVELRGPAVADAERAFVQSWRDAGGVVPADEREPTPVERAGDVSVRVIATVPATANMLRLDLLVASLARRTLWLTDAYFIGSTTYIQSLQRAAEDGVDVRLLLPAASDLGWIAAISRTLYRPLLESGVRVFEWSGSMLHAKTAVADGRWTRLGSTNLNVSSWIGNWELDVMIEHEGVARQMEAHFEEDMRNSTEVVVGIPDVGWCRKSRASGAVSGLPFSAGDRSPNMSSGRCWCSAC